MVSAKNIAIRLTLRPAALIAPLLMLIAAPAFADDFDFGPAKQSITELAQLPGKIQTQRTVVSTLFFGPGRVDVTCCKTSFIFCLEEQHYWYNLDLSGWRTGFQSQLQAGEQRSQAFTNQFAGQMQHWLKTTVPAISTQFDAASRNILAVQTQVQQGQGAIGQETATVASNLQQISTSLDQGRAELQTAISQLAAYLQQQRAFNDSMGGMKNSMDQNAQASLAKMRDFLNSQPCGQGDANNQFDAFRNRVTGSFNTVQNSLNQLTVDTAASDRAGSVLLGTMMNALTRFQLVSKQVGAAQNASSLNSAIEALHIAVAAQAWKDFATYAAKQM